MSEEEVNGIIIRIFFAVIVLSMFWFLCNYAFGVNCHIKSIGSDKYCVDSSNVTYDKSWEVRSHEQDRLNNLARQEAIELEKQKQEEFQRCYDSGYFVNESFTFIDYGLTCKRIDYLNNHLMDNFEKMDAGSISGRYSGFFSSGSISGSSYQYVDERVVATGQLIENINYQVDCNGNKHNEQIDFLTEEEFVMYYVMECVE